MRGRIIITASIWLSTILLVAEIIVESSNLLIYDSHRADAYKPERWIHDVLFLPESRAAFHRLVAKGWTDALCTIYPTELIYTYWDYFRNAYGRDAGLRIGHLLLSPQAAGHVRTAGVDREVRGWEKLVIMRRRGSS